MIDQIKKDADEHFKTYHPNSSAAKQCWVDGAIHQHWITSICIYRNVLLLIKEQPTSFAAINLQLKIEEKLNALESLYKNEK